MKILKTKTSSLINELFTSRPLNAVPKYQGNTATLTKAYHHQTSEIVGFNARQSTSAKPQKGLKSSIARKSIRIVDMDAGKMNPFPKDPSIRAISLLGGVKALNMRPNSQQDWLFLIRQGIPSLAVEAFSAHIQATNTEIAQLLGISTRKMALRRRAGALSHHESERLLRVARVVARAENVFDDLDNAIDWMRSPIIVLHGVSPFSLLDTEVGGELVMQTLGRIQHGIPA